jgi:ATP-dependent helicase/nuclease subunit A
MSGRKALLSRLGADAADPLDELLAAALEFEQGSTPTLQGFLAWMKASDTQIKREMEQAGQAIRIMTVHGAKGLEAPLVILADASTTLRDNKRLLFEPQDGPSLPLLTARREDEPPCCSERRAALLEKERQEYRRLLYVALTRAERQLIVAGWQGSEKEKQPEAEKRSWHDMVRDGLNRMAHVRTDTGQELPAGTGWLGEGMVYAHAPATTDMKEAHKTAPPVTDPLPIWIDSAPLPEPSPSRPLSPSREDSEDVVLSPLAEEESWRFRRGLLIHRLLQTLPALDPALRETAGRTWLEGQKADPALVTEVLAVLNTPEYAVLFGPHSRAEVPVTGIVGDRVLSGQIDRLAITDESVWLVDFKTNRERPESVESVPLPYLRQLSAYRSVLHTLYPDKQIRAVLLWTSGPELMEIPDTLLDAHAPQPLGNISTCESQTISVLRATKPADNI